MVCWLIGRSSIRTGKQDLEHSIYTIVMWTDDNGLMNQGKLMAIKLPTAGV